MARAGPGDGKFRPTKARPTREGGRRGWLGAVMIVVLILAGLGALLLLRGGSSGGGGGDAEPPRGGDHWHAAFGINICGQFQPDIPAFDTRSGSNEKAGIHSHADGLIHIHPLAPDETGGNATVGRYLDYAGGSISEDSITLPNGQTFTNGDRCRDGQAGNVRWSVNGKEQEGDPAEFKPENLDVVVVGFMPAGQDLGMPASAARVSTPSDT